MVLHFIGVIVTISCYHFKMHFCYHSMFIFLPLLYSQFKSTALAIAMGSNTIMMIIIIINYIIKYQCWLHQNQSHYIRNHHKTFAVFISDKIIYTIFGFIRKSPEMNKFMHFIFHMYFVFRANINVLHIPHLHCILC